MTYKGDLTSQETYDAIASDPNAVVIDVRTNAEWNFVGLPAIENLHLVQWTSFPTGARNENFVAEVKAKGRTEDQTLYLLCRSVQQSAAAASVLTASGFPTCYNVSDGFEGDIGPSGHRSTVNGWKHAGLPWRQG